MKDWNGLFVNNYGTPDLTLVKGKGVVVTDIEGRKYLDFLGGIATNVLGHAHPSVVKAVSKQISQLGHVSNFFAHPKALELAELLQGLTGDKSARVFFCNSGAEANEAALKLSRKTGKVRIVATEGAFHGRTMGALSLTGQRAKRAPFLPLLPKVVHVPFGDAKAMKRAVNRKTAMVIVEPIMGEAGVIVPPVGYLRDLRSICDSNGALLVIDCVQTGMGRTGTWFGYEHEDVKPDVITLAKGIGGGLPLGAMIAFGEAAQMFAPGDHGTTFGGNPVATAAGVAVIATIKKEKLLANATASEKVLKKALSNTPGVIEVRGRGLLLGIGLDKPIAMNLKKTLQLHGVIVNAPNESTIRIAPALNVKKSELDRFIKAFKAALKEVDNV